MAALKTARLALPSCGQVRFMSKVNIKHPRPRHLIRRIMEQVVRPIIVEEPEKWKTCTEKKIEETEVNPFEEFLVRHCQRMFEQNKMIIVCQPLPMTAEEQKAINNKFIKKGMTLQFQSNKVVRRVITDTKFTNMLPWIICRNLYIISPEERVADMMKILRRTPELVVLGGLVEDRLLSRQDLQTMSKLPKLDIMRAHLVHTLNTALSNTNTLVMSHQKTLSSHLDQYIKGKQEETE